MAHLPKGREDGETNGRRVQTEGVFKKCDACATVLAVMALRRNLDVCPSCGHHFQINARRRLEVTLDPDSFHELFTGLEALDPLEFKGKRSYLERVKEAQRKTGLKDAVICGDGKIQGLDVVIAVMDFQFIGGSMGSVVGEKITRTIERGTETGRPVILICCSGGARMDEGVLSLMQMAKTSAALYRHDQAGLCCFTVLTHPTLAGVSASFAFLGDVIIAEPKAMIGFTGARVIEQTIKKKLPEGFQESEFLLEHGQIDMVLERKHLRETLAKLLAFATNRPARKTATPLRIEPPVLAEIAPAAASRRRARAAKKTKKRKRA
ncbi:MAG TPA: acetyl-CoA carboxylase, carboxyltransferase subunit beta [Planctomycetota bacterium]|jgi:acetyl-CoA carboxylase carboxyl transferase subunit beta